MRALWWAACLAWAGVAAAGGLDTASRAAGDAEAERVLARHPIRAAAEGTVALAYPDIVRMFGSTSLLADVQAEYARELPRGKAPEFVITQTGPREYFYVNRAGQESRIREVHRAEHEGPATEVVFYIRGRRFFGEFEAVIHIAARPQGDAVAYAVDVYAHPHQTVARFLGRHLRLVSLYFHSKTDEIEALSIRISRALCRADVATR